MLFFITCPARYFGKKMLEISGGVLVFFFGRFVFRCTGNVGNVDINVHPFSIDIICKS
jgi:hypothetical protein